jgi:HlyD family secretion protein
MPAPRALRAGALSGLLACAALVGCGASPGGGLPGTLERDRVELAATADEPIVEIKVREGQSVAAGALLLVQDPGIADAQLDQARARLAQAEARRDELDDGPLATTIAAARARAERAGGDLEAAERERRRLQDLAARRLVSQAAYDQQAALATAAAATRREADASLRELQQGTRAEQRRQAARAVEQAAASLRELQLGSGRLEVRAPRDAVVDALPWQVGERPPKGATVAVLLASGAPFARIHLPAAMRLRVQVGTPAVVRVDGRATALTGRVRYVASDAAFTPYYSLTETDRSRLSYLAEVELPDADAAQLPAGIPLEVDLQFDASA